MKSIMKFVSVLTLILSLFGCAKPKAFDGDGSVYHDEDYRTAFANVFDFAFSDKDVLFAVAFLGYGEEGRTHRNNFVNSTFEGLSDKVEHFDFDGDEWYLVVPRYRDAVAIEGLDADGKYMVFEGEAFTVKCNLSDLYPNVRICTLEGKGKFSPHINGEGRLVTNPFVHDITDYSVTTDYLMEGEE